MKNLFRLGDHVQCLHRIEVFECARDLGGIDLDKSSNSVWLKYFIRLMPKTAFLTHNEKECFLQYYHHGIVVKTGPREKDIQIMAMTFRRQNKNCGGVGLQTMEEFRKHEHDLIFKHKYTLCTDPERAARKTKLTHSYVPVLLSREETQSLAWDVWKKDQLDTVPPDLPLPDKRLVYSWETRNCEHFSRYCKTKSWQSTMIEQCHGSVRMILSRVAGSALKWASPTPEETLALSFSACDEPPAASNLDTAWFSLLLLLCAFEKYSTSSSSKTWIPLLATSLVSIAFAAT